MGYHLGPGSVWPEFGVGGHIVLTHGPCPNLALTRPPYSILIASKNNTYLCIESTPYILRQTEALTQRLKHSQYVAHTPTKRFITLICWSSQSDRNHEANIMCHSSTHPMNITLKRNTVRIPNLCKRQLWHRDTERSQGCWVALCHLNDQELNPYILSSFSSLWENKCKMLLS